MNLAENELTCYLNTDCLSNWCRYGSCNGNI